MLDCDKDLHQLRHRAGGGLLDRDDLGSVHIEQEVEHRGERLKRVVQELPAMRQFRQVVVAPSAAGIDSVNAEC